MNTTASTGASPGVSHGASLAAGRSRFASFDRTWLLGLSMLSVQLGAGFAGRLMRQIGAPGTVLFRQGIAAVVLLAVARPSVRMYTRAEWRTICALGVVFAAMNVTFYAAVERLPLGAAVTVELLGPLGLAAGLSRRLRDLGCVALALAGVVLLGWGGEHLDTFGLVLAVAAAGGWASYIMLSRSAGKASDGMGSLGLAMALAAVLVAPFGLAPGSALLRPNVMALGTVVAVLGALVPFSLELTALRHVPPRVFGVLMSLSPVAAVLSGWLLLGQDLTLRDAVAMVMVMVASLITVRTAENRPSARTRTRA